MASGVPRRGTPEHLGRVIAARVAEWGGVDLPLERLTFGTTEPDAIAAAIDEWCVTNLGADIERYHFFGSSSGSVHGVQLRDGRDVVVKVHRPDLNFAFLDAVTTVQRAFADNGLAAPRPLAGPVPFGPVHITAETMLDTGPAADGHDPAVRGGLARAGPRRRSGTGFGARRNRRAPPPHGHAHERALPAAALGPLRLRGHRGRRRMDRRPRTRAGRDVLAHGDAGPEVLVHGDWRIENVNVAGGEVVAIYDWDSVCIEPELYAVRDVDVHVLRRLVASGRRALPVERRDACVHRRVRVSRGTPFSEAHRDLLAARIVYGLAYGARCEHADLHPDVADSQQGLLHRLGDTLLARGLRPSTPETTNRRHFARSACSSDAGSGAT